MLGIDRRTLNVAWTLFLFVLTLFIVGKIGRTIGLFAVAVVFAHLLSPVVGFVERLFPKTMPRVAVLAIVYVVLIGALIAAMVPIVTRISQEAASLARQLPQVLQSDPLAHIPIPKSLEQFRPDVTAYVHGRLAGLGGTVGPFLTGASERLITGLGSVFSVVLVPILAFLFLKDGAAIRDTVVESIPPGRRELADSIITDLNQLLSQYIRALVLLAIATFIFYSLFLTITGGPFPALLAGVAALLEFIPAIGPLSAAVIITVVSAIIGFPHMLMLVVFLGAYRLFQDFVLSPYLMSSGVEIHPLLVLFGVLAGEQLLGIPGMFFSVPVIAALRLIVVRLRSRRRARA